MLCGAEVVGEELALVIGDGEGVVCVMLGGAEVFGEGIDCTVAGEEVGVDAGLVNVVLDGVEVFCSGRAVGVLDGVVLEELVEDALDIVVVEVARRFPTDCTALAGATVDEKAIHEVWGHPSYLIPSEVGAQREDISDALSTS